MDKEIIQKRFNVPSDSKVVLLSCKFEDESFLTFASSFIHYLKVNPELPVHFFIVGDIKTMAIQKKVDEVMRQVWLANVRPHIHIYSFSDTIPAEFIVMSDLCFFMNDTIKNASESSDQTVIISSNDTGAMKLDAIVSLIDKHLRQRQRESVIEVGTKTISLLMRASNNDTLKDSVEAALATFPDYHEFLVSLSPSLHKEIVEYIKNIPRVKIIEGTSNRELAGDLHYRMMDMCSGDWIVNIDDDDLWIHKPDLSLQNEKIALIHGDYLFLNYYRPIDHIYRVALHKGRQIKTYEDIGFIDGSMWIIQRKAWNSISNLLTDRSYNYSDWRAFYMLKKQGWETMYIAKLFGVQRRFEYNFPTGPGTKWVDVVKTLQ